MKEEVRESNEVKWRAFLDDILRSFSEASPFPFSLMSKQAKKNERLFNKLMFLFLGI